MTGYNLTFKSKASSGTECGMQLCAGESNHFGHVNHHNQLLPADVFWSDQYQFSRQLKCPHQPHDASSVGMCGSRFLVKVWWNEQVLGPSRPQRHAVGNLGQEDLVAVAGLLCGLLPWFVSSPLSTQWKWVSSRPRDVDMESYHVFQLLRWGQQELRCAG